MISMMWAGIDICNSIYYKLSLYAHDAHAFVFLFFVLGKFVYVKYWQTFYVRFQSVNQNRGFYLQVELTNIKSPVI